MNTKELFDKEVLDMNAKKVGTITDIDFDLRKGVLNHIMCKTGLFRKHLIDIKQIDKIGDKLVLKTTKYDLEQTK